SLLQPAEMLVDLFGQPFREPCALAHVCTARLGRDREAGGHGDPELRHLGEPDALAAEELAPAFGWLVEVVDVPHRAPDLPTAARATPARALRPGCNVPPAGTASPSTL